MNSNPTFYFFDLRGPYALTRLEIGVKIITELRAIFEYILRKVESPGSRYGRNTERGVGYKPRP